IRGDAEEYPSEAVHAGLRSGLEIVRHHEEDSHARTYPLAKAGGGLFRTVELRAARHELPAIAPRPAVVLGVGELDVLGAHALGHFEDVFDVVDVETMQHHVEDHGVAVLLDERGHFRFQLECPGAAQEIVHPARAVLEGELDVIETCFLQRLQTWLGETHPGGDEVGVEPEPMGGRDDGLEILADQRLTAREPQLHRAERPRLLENAQPLRGLELPTDVLEVRRVVAEDAMQRASVGELEEEPERRTCRRGGRRSRLAHARNSTQLRSTASSMNANTSEESPVAA